MPGGGHFDYRLKAENLIRSSPYSWATSYKKLERSNNYFSRFDQPWISPEVKRLARRKKRYHSRAIKFRTAEARAKFKAGKHEVQSECRKAYYSYINSMITGVETKPGNLKRFWSFIKSKKCDNSGVAPLRRDGVAHSDSQVKANILNDQFSSFFTKEDTSTIPSLGDSTHPHLARITVSEEGVQKLLGGLKIHSAADSDEIPARLLKEYASELALALTLIFQASLDQSRLEACLVLPVFKTGERARPSNCRPISLTCIACKCLEHIIHSNIMDYLDNNAILSDFQHGFRKKRSCDTQLIQTVHDLAKCLHNGEQIDAALLDFSKAFDKVPHARLEAKLNYYGIRGNTLQWIKCFLSQRSQQVVLEGKTPASAPVTSGVPQGSVLGPLLFLCYINDLPSCVSSTPRLFADACLLYRRINSPADAVILQQD